MIKWINKNEVPVPGIPAAETKEILSMIETSKGWMKKEWQTVDSIVRDYENSYDRMFRYKISSTEFLSFLKNSNRTYWEIGNSLGKINHAVYCWDVMTMRFNDRKLPWPQLQEVIRLLHKIFEPEKKITTSMAW